MLEAAFPLAELFDTPLPRLKVVDVGALPLDGHIEIYQGLLDRALCDVVAFEPDQALCDRLNAEGDGSRTFLPYFIGDGAPATFRLCRAPMTSSLYEPNTALLEKFQNLSELVEVVSREPVDTVRLDELEAVKGADFLKLDVQGAEHAVIEGAATVLESVAVVHTEVEFVPLYKDQPLFAEVDQALRGKGFQFHKFLGFAGRAFKPTMVPDEPNALVSQMLWSEAVYVRDFMALEALSPARLLKMAMILHEVYGSVDLALLCLREWDQKTGSKVAMEYQARLATGAA
ncbi:MAG: FkbM family methyltransferase [Alphaproteobacteria bacterium]|nr:FkbM family methyltransferase [Alphaproteobacteria bacterium]